MLTGRIAMESRLLRRSIQNSVANRSGANESQRSRPMKCWFGLLASALLLTTGCAPTLLVKRDVAISRLALYVEYGDSLDQPTAKALSAAACDFVNEYNTEAHRLVLVSCTHDTDCALKVNVSKTHLVGPGQQAAGCLVSTLGCITPFAMLAANMPLIVWFAYVPRNGTTATVSLSSDIAVATKPVTRPFQSFPYFGGIAVQRARHASAFKRFLRGLVGEVEKGLGR